jgi:hypothetical protein
MFDPLPIISDDDPDSFVSLSEAARATFERLAELHGLPAGGAERDRCPLARGGGPAQSLGEEKAS